ncbi:MAG TPA: 4'-phosphopantetheinyl transferase superfamily protein [Burkholderiales bacterium]|nr:4'-phosphopantetheinyl transferase superfamily protein [Burkholderiales bacterium]
MHFPLDPQIAQRVVLLPGCSKAKRGPRQRRTRDEQFRLRQSIFDLGRACAAELLAELGSGETSVAMAADRSPVWPQGYVGSITHTDELLGVAVARRKDFRSIGIDAEAIVQPDTTVEIDELCMGERERALRDSAGIDRQTFSSLCFSAKESFFKCLYPLTGVWFDFQDAEIASFDPDLQLLQMRLLRDLASGFRQGQVFGGAFRWTDRRVYTAFALPSQ